NQFKMRAKWRKKRQINDSSSLNRTIRTRDRQARQQNQHHLESGRINQDDVAQHFGGEHGTWLTRAERRELTICG
ncbi:hypothetical protein PspLS_00479, partial [Pyricularia sp. CBS 133598]